MREPNEGERLEPATRAGAADTAAGEDAAALERDADLHRSVLASMQEGVVVQALDGSIVSCNPTAERILGLTHDEMTGRRSTDARWRTIREDGSPFPGDAHPAMVTLRTGEPQRDVVMGVRKPDGALAWISIHSQPLVDARGEMYGAVTTFADITRRNNALRELERSEARLRLALGAARMGTWEYVSSTGRVEWTPEVAALFGVAHADFGGTFDAFIELVHPDDRQQVLDAVEEAMTRYATDERRFEVEHRVHRHGRVRWVRGYGQVLVDETGAPLLMRGTVVDVTEQRQLESQLLEAQKLESVGRLAGGIAHDFNNLMTAVLGAAELVALELEPTHPAAPHLQVISEGVQRAGALTRQLLAFARKQVLDVTAVDIDGALSDMRGILEQLAGPKVSLELACDSDAVVRADRSQLERVLTNLVMNAREAMPEGGAIEIGTSCVELDGSEGPVPLPPGVYVQLEVRDQGVGMTRDELRRACEPFFTTKPEGSGLGLATCYGIVTQMQGHLELRSQSGAGTTARVWLPVVEAAPVAPSGPARAEAPAGGETVLVVEDEPMVRRVAVSSLRQLGYTVLEADSGSGALSLLDDAELCVDLLVTDVVMPGISGIELAENFLERFPEAAVLLMSGYAADALAARPKEGPALPLLTKPYTLQQLASSVHAAIHGA